MVIDKPLMPQPTGGAGGISPTSPGGTRPEANTGSAPAPSFGDVLKTKVVDVKAEKADSGLKSEGVKFSQHALERMANRGISFKPEDLMRLNDAIEKASKKGSRESLVLMGDNALIVSVKNKTVVTAMDREAMKENVFTNIDSTVIL